MKKKGVRCLLLLLLLLVVEVGVLLAVGGRARGSRRCGSGARVL
jgi:hypothetical protein